MNDLADLQWEKMQGLIPAIIQDEQTGDVLMLGYMDREALHQSLTSKQVTFYSRSQQRLWRKGETSGNVMHVLRISQDCDGDALLVQVSPRGPACHLGFITCFQPAQSTSLAFLYHLTSLISDRAHKKPKNSYCTSLLNSGIDRCAQKVGEEAVETVIAAINRHPDDLISESADLLFHLLILFQACQINLSDVILCLQQRHQKVQA